MRKFLLLLIAGAFLLAFASVSFASDAQTVNGWISDSKCGVKGANAGAEACTKKCIAAGASTGGRDRYRSEGPDGRESRCS